MDPAFFSACTLGLEPALARELTDLGAGGVRPGRGGVEFRADPRIAFRACLWLRSAVHVQELVVEAAVRSAEELYARTAAVEWERVITPDGTLAVDASVRDSFTTHSGFAALKTKDAVVDRFRDRYGRRPDVDPKQPQLPLKLVLRQDRMRLYRVWSGTSLHKRGYRPIQVKSPLNEATAAGLLLLSDWDRQSALLDPMCGSGTFPIEAALLALDRAPNLEREFAAEHWLDVDQSVLAAARREARERARSSTTVKITGADQHAGALGIAARSARAAGVESFVKFVNAPLADLVPPVPPQTVVVNPPWGERMGQGPELVAAWQDLGRFLHSRCQGATAWVLSGNAEITRELGLRATARIPVWNGPIDCRWLRYEVFAAKGERP